MNYENYRPDWDKPSIFTAQQYGTKVSVEVERSDMDLDEVMDAFQTLLIGMGYHQDSFKKWVIERAEEYAEDDEEKSAFDDKEDEREFYNQVKQAIQDRLPKVNEEEEDEFFGKYTTDCYCGHTDKCDCGPEDGYLATEEDEDEFDDYGMRISKDRPHFEWGDEPEDDEDLEFPEPNEELKEGYKKYKKALKTLSAKQKKKSK